MTRAVGLRPEGRRRLLVHGGHRLGHRAQLHRLRAAAERRDGADVRGRARSIPDRTASGGSSKDTKSTSSTLRRRRSGRSCGWARSIRGKLRHEVAAAARARVGEPINPEAWMWYRDVIGRDRCPIVDTWWQTETGAIMISPLPGATPTKPGSATLPLPGIAADVVDKDGNPVPPGSGGFLVVRRPWPSMLRTIYGDPARYQSGLLVADRRACTSPATARARTPTATSGSWAASTTCSTSRGHRLSTMEVESALVAHPEVAEAAVVGRPDEIKGQAHRRLRHAPGGHAATSELKEELRAVGRQGDRLARQARRHPLQRGAAEDAQRQDHAAAAARGRRRRRGEGRYDDAGRPQRASRGCASRTTIRPDEARSPRRASRILICAARSKIVFAADPRRGVHGKDIVVRSFGGMVCEAARM